MLERWDRLSQYRVQWPEWNVAFVAGVLRYLTLAFPGGARLVGEYLAKAAA